MSQSSIFLIDKKKNKFEFDRFPDWVYLDTSFVKTINSGAKQDSIDCSEFLKYGLENNATFCISGLVEQELMHVIKKTTIEEIGRKNKIKKVFYNDRSFNSKKYLDDVRSVEPKLIEIINRKTNESLELIREFTVCLDYKSTQEFNDNVMKLMKMTDYKLGVNDAQHAIIAHEYNINSIATFDGDFWALNDFNIYTTGNDKYKIERLNRSNSYLEFNDDLFVDKSLE